MHERAGIRALPGDLINVDDVTPAYYDIVPDPINVGQHVASGTSGHRGSSLDAKFSETHIIAIAAAIIEYRASQGFSGPLFIGRGTHALSEPVRYIALGVLTAAGIDTRIDSRGSYTPTPAVSVAILGANGAPGNLRTEGDDLADGIAVTPSHNLPRDGGFKYDPPHGNPAGTDATGWIAACANELLDLGEWKNVPRVTGSDLLHDPNIKPFDYLDCYVSQLDRVIDIEAIRSAGVRIGVDPLGGVSIDYWAAIGEHYGLDLTVINPEVGPAWPSMILDWDSKIRMDCSSPYAMASLCEAMTPDAEGNIPYDIATDNDADSDHHGIVTPDGLMNPNHFLVVAIEYLFTHRPGWNTDTAVGKTLVSSMLIDRVIATMGRDLIEVPVGFKYFVPGLLSGAVGFGGEESAGASFLRKDGTVRSTDKDDVVLALLTSEILVVTGKTPSQLHGEQIERSGASAYAHIDAAASREEKAKLAALSADDVTATELAGDPIVAKLVCTPGNDASIGGLKVMTESAWFTARPSGTEGVYKIYGESFKGAKHLAQVQEAAKQVVPGVLNG